MPYRGRLVVKTRKKRGIGGCVHRDSDFVSVNVSFVHGGIAFGNSAGQPLLLHTEQRICLAGLPSFSMSSKSDAKTEQKRPHYPPGSTAPTGRLGHYV